MADRKKWLVVRATARGYCDKLDVDTIDAYRTKKEALQCIKSRVRELKAVWDAEGVDLYVDRLTDGSRTIVLPKFLPADSEWWIECNEVRQVPE